MTQFHSGWRRLRGTVSFTWDIGFVYASLILGSLTS